MNIAFPWQERIYEKEKRPERGSKDFHCYSDLYEIQIAAKEARLQTMLGSFVNVHRVERTHREN